MTKDPGEVLASARRYVHDKDYCNALEAYEYFFDHALDEDPAAFYGVRLSYCLDEWARLGKVFPAAQERLKEKRNSTLKALHDERNPELFHDYQSICEYLGSPEVPVKEFLRLHGSDPELAKSCKRFIWENLIENEHWEVCGSYLDSPKSDLKNAFSKFDQSMTICMSDPSLGGETFENQIRQWFVRDVSNILLVL